MCRDTYKSETNRITNWDEFIKAAVDILPRAAHLNDEIDFREMMEQFAKDHPL